jgi:hypothetical protein
MLLKRQESPILAMTQVYQESVLPRYGKIFTACMAMRVDAWFGLHGHCLPLLWLGMKSTVC